MTLLSNFGLLFLRISHGSRVVSGIDQKLGAYTFIWAIVVVAPMCISPKQHRSKLKHFVAFLPLENPTQISALNCKLQVRIHKDPPTHLITDRLCRTLRRPAFISTTPIFVWSCGRRLTQMQSAAIFALFVVVACICIYFRRILCVCRSRGPSQLSTDMIVFEKYTPHCHPTPKKHQVIQHKQSFLDYIYPTKNTLPILQTHRTEGVYTREQMV